MFCIECGKQLPQEARFCAYCGTKIFNNNNTLPKANEIPNSNESDVDFKPLPAFDEFSDATVFPDFNKLDELDTKDVMPDFDTSELTEFVELEVPKDTTIITSEMIYSLYGKGEGFTCITIPDGVVEIDGIAFCEWKLMEKIIIPNSVKIIGQEVFRGCSSLVEVNIPNSIIEIKQGAFSGCESLKKIKIPNSVIHIGSYAFSNCTSLYEIIIPNRITKIGNEPFDNCSAALIIHCPSGSDAEMRALEGWIKFKLTNRSSYQHTASSKPKPLTNGRLCGTACCNINFGLSAFQQNGHEYSGWYYDIFFDNTGFCDLVRFDEDNAETIEYLWRSELKKPKSCEIIVQANRFGVYVFILSNVLCFNHDGHLVKLIEADKFLPEIEANVKKDVKEWKEKYDYECNLFSSVWVYGEVLYFTTKFDAIKGIIYKYDLAIDDTYQYKILKPRNCKEFNIEKLTGDDRYLYFGLGGGESRLFDTYTEKTYKINAYYIDFETKRCYYYNEEIPVFTPEGFNNINIKKPTSGFYSKHLFTGEAFYGFRYGHTKEFSNETDYYYNLYKFTDNNWLYMNAGSRGSIEYLSVQGNYLYFDPYEGRRVKLDGSVMDTGWYKINNECSVLMKIERTFRKFYLQTEGIDV